MSFKDLTARAAAALKPKPAEIEEKPRETEAPETTIDEPVSKSRTT